MSVRVLFIVGPTGSGKSKLALALARKMNGAILSCDSMQIYKGMDIGTGKATGREQKKAPHYLISMISSRAECSAFKYRRLALNAVREVASKGQIPIVVGGSGLYLKAVLDGLDFKTGKQAKIRNELDRSARRRGVPSLYRTLLRMDPKRARAIHPNDKRRIIRALEILKVENRRKSNEEDSKGNRATIHPLIFGLLRGREELYERIEKRVDRMFAHGWVEEVRRLKQVGLSQTAKAAIGYREILEFLCGKKTFEETKDAVKKRTRHLAKKQMTWFRKDQRIRWISVAGDPFIPQALRTIVRHLKSWR